MGRQAVGEGRGRARASSLRGHVMEASGCKEQVRRELPGVQDG
jgi:hypothetical protein